MRRHDDPDRFLPLRPDVFAVLLALCDGDLHGYAIIKAASDRAGRRGQLQPGALYRLLRDMLREQLIVEVNPPQTVDRHDERRRYYRVTPFGRDVARAESRRMSAVLAQSRRLGLLSR